MKQSEIKSLLIEASDPDCNMGRQQDILASLIGETAAAEIGLTNACGRPEEGVELILGKLFTETIVNNQQQMLPKLFPAFAIICGDREENALIAEVDWSLVE